MQSSCLSLHWHYQLDSILHTWMCLPTWEALEEAKVSLKDSKSTGPLEGLHLSWIDNRVTGHLQGHYLPVWGNLSRASTPDCTPLLDAQPHTEAPSGKHVGLSAKHSLLSEDSRELLNSFYSQHLNLVTWAAPQIPLTLHTNLPLIVKHDTQLTLQTPELRHPINKPKSTLKLDGWSPT